MSADASSVFHEVNGDSAGGGGMGVSVGVGVEDVIPTLQLHSQSSPDAQTPQDQQPPAELQQLQTGNDITVVKVEVSSPDPVQLTSQSLLNQMNQLGPSDRCTPSQAQAMGQQLLSIIAVHERSTMPLPIELQNSFDIFHRCLAVVYGTFFLNLYTKANAPCLLCHGCKSLYPPGQFIHHTCPALPPNIVPCRSRMWRRCLVPLVSQGIDKLQQKQRWKYVIEKFSHSTAGGVRRNPIPPSAEAQLLEMPECKRGRFVEPPVNQLSSAVSTASSGSPTDDAVITQPEDLLGSGNKTLLEIDQLDCEDDENGSSDLPPGLITFNSTTQPSSASSSPPPLPTQPQAAARSSSPLALAEQLVGEVRRLQQELAKTKSRLQVAEELLRKLPSESAMREQLAQALATQQAMRVERDQAKDQCRLAHENTRKLQTQLDRLQKAHTEMERHFMILD